MRFTSLLTITRFTWVVGILGSVSFASGSGSALAQVLERHPASLQNSPAVQYLLISAADFAAAHLVETERPLGRQTQQVDIVNLQVPLPSAFPMAPQLVASGTMLITLVALPDATSGQLRWQPIWPDTLAPARRITAAAFTDTCLQRLARYHRKGGRLGEDNALTRSADIKPIIWRDGRYWTPAGYTLTELFLVCPVPFTLPHQADNVTISLKARPFPLAQFEQEWQLGQRFYPSGRRAGLAQVLASKLFLEKKLPDGTYEFYTAATNIMDGGSFYAGAEDFRYRPGIGLVSGKYSTHFSLGSQDTRNIFFTTKRILAIE
ncbi:hypothetical protein [Hymenobacter actinosclerus]|uniref:Uncharacterized protein n=1 Tax=Hymenobacter actinosclerus TaxID=82805 RepID=A0A1I0DXA5_9BACT|nr:hypothetical protein [Hymenobacter actinosclerus]SET37345.1 hypothetical protein SAMN04487998_1608 [Hymenobacter actinosclerus]